MALKRGVAVAALALAVVVSGCAAMEATRRSPGVITDGKFSPTRPVVAQYGPDPALGCVQGGAVGALADSLASSAKSDGKPAPQMDGRLCAMADTLMSWDEKQLVPQGLLRSLANHFGAVGPTPRAVVATIESEDSRAVADRLFDAAYKYTAQAPASRVGAVTQRVRKGVTKAVLVVQDATVELQPVPKAVPAGGKVTVAGRVIGKLENPKVLACDATGKLAEPAASPGKDFRAELSCGERPGILAVEIRASSGGAEESLARFPVACGVQPATAFAIPSAKAGAVDPAKAARTIFDGMNAERAAGGLKPLAWDDAVAGVARAAAEALRDTQATQVSFDLVARLRKAEVASSIVLQNAAAATSVEDVSSTVDASPRDRAQVLNPQVTNAGVGVAAGSTPEGVPVVYATELLTRENPPFDAVAVEASLRKAIDQRRADARAPKLADDPALDEVAKKYAAALAAGKGTIPKDQESAIVAPLYKAYRSVNIMSGVKPDPVEFAEEPGIVSPAKEIGVGIASGTSKALGKNSAYVVVLTGDRR